MELTQERANEIVEALISKMGEDEFDRMREQMYLYRILVSVYFLSTVDSSIIIKDIYDSFGGIIPLGAITEIVHTHLPIIVRDCIMDDGRLTPDAIEIAIAHNDLLSLGYIKSKKHLH